MTNACGSYYTRCPVESYKPGLSMLGAVRCEAGQTVPKRIFS